MRQSLVPQRYRTAFLRDLAVRLDRMDEAVARLRLDPSAAPAVQEALRREAHELKGTGSVFGFPAVTGIAAALEREVAGVSGASSEPVTAVGRRLDALRDILTKARSRPGHADTGQRPSPRRGAAVSRRRSAAAAAPSK